MQPSPDLQEHWQNPASVAQPVPTDGEIVVLGEAMQALLARAEMGKTKYGTLLMTSNGRDAAEDWYQEQCDGFMYATQFILEWRQLKKQGVSS